MIYISNFKSFIIIIVGDEAFLSSIETVANTTDDAEFSTSINRLAIALVSLGVRAIVYLNICKCRKYVVINFHIRSFLFHSATTINYIYYSEMRKS